MASIAAEPSIYAGRELAFGSLPPADTYLLSAVRAVAEAATGQ
eukprot:COSAG06_NODE_40003_length_406_cov_1.169381_1_plen_42_part_10